MTTVQAFLEPKARGFISFIESLNPDDEVKSRLKNYTPDKIIPTITLFVCPAYASGTIPLLAAELFNHLKPQTGQLRDEIVKRIERYLFCFAEAVTSS